MIDILLLHQILTSDIKHRMDTYENGRVGDAERFNDSQRENERLEGVWVCGCVGGVGGEGYTEYVSLLLRILHFIRAIHCYYILYLQYIKPAIFI